MLSPESAAAFARVALSNVARELPHKIDHVLLAPGEPLSPRGLHPAFYGSFDWHSAVHMHWVLARLWKAHPELPMRAQIAARLEAHLSGQAIEAELAYFRAPAGRTFERPYGWAWLLKLQAELVDTPWQAAVAPLAAELASRFGRFIEAPYPIRSGSHGNTAFACLLALDYARAAAQFPLVDRINRAAQRWYSADRDAPLHYEPSMDDFLSPVLVEALLMKELMPAGAFLPWLERFLPAGIGPLARPPSQFDRTDPKQVHLDGLALSRAWCLRRLGFREAAERHLAAAMPHVLGGDYVGEHWLASFAMLALAES